MRLGEPPLVRAALINLGPGEHKRLVIVVHHLVIDGVSWRLLIDDLQVACGQRARGEQITLPPATRPPHAFAAALERSARAGAFDDELSYWLAQGNEASFPRDHDAALDVDTVEREGHLVVRLDEEETGALLGMAAQARMDDLILAALTRALAPWLGRRSIAIDLESHGREVVVGDGDVSRSIGWFTTVHPLRMEIADRSPSAALHEIQSLRARVPRYGIGYFALKYLQPATAAQLGAVRRAEILFNYLGQFRPATEGGIVVGLAAESAGPCSSPRNRRSHLIEVNAVVNDGALVIDIGYCAVVHERATVERLGSALLEALRESAREPLLPDTDLNDDSLERVLSAMSID